MFFFSIFFSILYFCSRRCRLLRLTFPAAEVPRPIGCRARAIFAAANLPNGDTRSAERQPYMWRVGGRERERERETQRRQTYSARIFLRAFKFNFVSRRVSACRFYSPHPAATRMNRGDAFVSFCALVVLFVPPPPYHPPPSSPLPLSRRFFSRATASGSPCVRRRIIGNSIGECRVVLLPECVD